MFNEWTLELKAMADRIISMRQQLFDALKSRGTCFFCCSCLLFVCLTSDLPPPPHFFHDPVLKLCKLGVVAVCLPRVDAIACFGNT
jgi:hypothetical protein